MSWFRYRIVMTMHPNATPSLSRKPLAQRPSGGLARIVIALGLADLALIALHVTLVVATRLDLLVPAPWHVGAMLTTDRGLPEVYLHAKWLAAALLLGSAALRQRIPLYAGFAVLFLIVLADDSLSLHENGGTWLAEALSLPAVLGLRAKDPGEIMVWAALGVPALAAIVLGWRRTAPADRGLALPLALTLAALVFVAAGLDMLHIMVGSAMDHGRARTLVMLAFDVAEDGGEMLLGTVAVALGLVARLSRRRGAAA
jgi:hypothetical protein